MAASIMEFSPNGDYFALCGPEGTLRIWDTTTNALKQEYVPSSHLSATCTCLNWRPGRKKGDSASSSKRKKRKSELHNDAGVGAADLIALGTSSGSVVIYSVLRGDLQASWGNGHENSVNGVTWCKTKDTLFTCSSDSYIVEWDVTKGVTWQRWKCEGPLYSLCLCYDDTMLLTASHSIKLWDLSMRKVVQTFVGHSTEVFRLLDTPRLSASNSDSMYFLSAAKDDRHIQVWHSKNLKKSKMTQKALAALQLTDPAADMNISGPMADGAYLFSAVTVTGWFLLFRQVLNGECKKPLQPKVKLQIATSNLEVSKQLPVLSAIMSSGEKILLAYGNPLKPLFENISYGGLERENCLIRDEPLNDVRELGEVSKTKTPITPCDAKLLTPGHLVPSKPTEVSSKSKKRRRRHASVDLTVEERLDVMGLAEKADKPNLQTTSSAILLAQGLQSKDQSIINHVLQNNNPGLIRNTIRKLPIPLIIPLVDELSRRMQGHAQASSSIIGWVKSLLTIHSSYLMTFPELVQNLSTLYQMMDARLTNVSKMCQFQGKLELVLAQVSNQSEADDAVDNIEALVTLQDESSDDDMLILGNDENDGVDTWEDEESEMEPELDDQSAEEDDDDDDAMDDQDDSQEMEHDDDDASDGGENGGVDGSDDDDDD